MERWILGMTNKELQSALQYWGWVLLNNPDSCAAQDTVHLLELSAILRGVL
jgi:hypothetical protein